MRKTLGHVLAATGKKQVRLQRGATRMLAALGKRAAALAGKKISDACATRIDGLVESTTRLIQGS